MKYIILTLAVLLAASAFGQSRSSIRRVNAASTDNTLVRHDGTGGRLVQDTSVVVDDSDNVSGINILSFGSYDIDLDTLVGTAIVTDDFEQQSISADTTYTFATTPSTGQVFGLRVTTDSTARQITLPANVYSLGSLATITTVDVPASSTVDLRFHYDGTTYFLSGDTSFPVRTEFVPIGWFEDGAAAPAALETFADTRKVDIRKFDSATTENVEGMWVLPSDAMDADITTADWQLKYRVLYIVTEATGPSAEGVSFNLQGVAIADNEDIGAATLGTVSESDDASTTAVQNDMLYSDWTEITLAGAVAGESVFMLLERDHDDTVDDYLQDIGVVGIELKYQYDSATY